MSKERGKALKRARTTLGLTQQDVATRLTVSRAAVGQWENGHEISGENLIAVCKVLGIEVQGAVEGNVNWTNSAAKGSKFKDQKSITNENYDKYYISYIKIDENNDSSATRKNLETAPKVQLYVISEPTDEIYGGNCDLSENPMLALVRPDWLHDDENVYLAVVDVHVMEPYIKRGTTVVSYHRQMANVGDYVFVLLRPKGRYPVSFPHAVSSVPCYFGAIVSMSPTEIVIEQPNPEARFTIPLGRVAGVHKLGPMPTNVG